MVDQHKTPSIARSGRTALIFGLSAAILYLCLQSLSLPEVLHEGKIFFLDPDSYTWLERADHVLSGSGLYVHHDPTDNYPKGYAPHWTQPFHWLLALLAGLFRLFLDEGKALETAGMWICPLLGALTAGCVSAWACRRWPWPAALMMPLVFMIHPFELWSFALGRPDHQCLIVFFCMAAVLLILDRDPLEKPAPGRDAACALFLAAGVWVSVQVLSIWGLVMVMLVLRASMAQSRNRVQEVRATRFWCSAGALGALLFSLAEGSLLEIHSDSLSLGQVILMAMPAAGLTISLHRIQRKSAMKPFAWFLVCTVPPALLTCAAAAGLWQFQVSQYSPDDHEAMGRWFSTNMEFLPAWFTVQGEIGLGRIHSAFGWSLYLLPLLIYGVSKTELIHVTAKRFLIVGITMASGLTLWQMRWRDMHALVLFPVFAIALYEWMKRIKMLHGLHPGLRTAVTVGCGLLLLSPWLHDDWMMKSRPQPPSASFRAIRQICESIRKRDPMDLDEKNPAILAVWDQGPMVRYWSKRPVVAGPYHRNIEGIMDTMHAYASRSSEAFALIAKRRKLRYVLRPPLADPYYDLYSFEWICGIRDPMLFIRTQHLTADGRGTARGYDLCPGKTVEQLESTLRFRLENNQWESWAGLKPVPIPGLDRLVGDAEAIPYLYQLE
ncbi:MAG: hypothetical protein ABIK28_00680 [Planctomycetota bacterium]